jgi:polar amino acid transport system substrate-binding protein
MKTVLIAAMLVMSLMLESVPAGSAPAELAYIAEEAAPQNYLEQGVLKGYAAELLAAMWERMGMKPKKIQFLPWDKAYQRALEQPGTVLLTTTRLEQRENLFKWVGPINSPRFSLFADKNHGIRLSRLDEAKKYRIGTVINDAAEMLLLKRGFTKDQLDRSHDIKSGLEQLKKGKCDLFAYSEMSMKQSLKLFNLDANQYVNTIPISGSLVFYAFHKDTPDSVIKNFQEALNSLKTDGTYIAIKKKYGYFD